ncbi:MaoC/PaaZ C-terminal domain-containing protein [Rhodococcus koreensis]
MSLWFDDLPVGRSWRSPSRTVTEADVGNFAGLTGDFFPLHTSEAYAADSEFGTRIAHGLLGLTFAHGLMWSRTGQLDESIIAFLGIKDWRFSAPIYFGDSVRVEYEVVERRSSTTRTDRGVVDFEVRVLNQHDAVIQQGVKSLLVAKETR